MSASKASSRARSSASSLFSSVLDLIASNLLEIDDGEAAALPKAVLLMIDAFFTFQCSRCFGGVVAGQCALFFGGVTVSLELACSLLFFRREDDRLEVPPTEDGDTVRPRVSGMMVEWPERIGQMWHAWQS